MNTEMLNKIQFDQIRENVAHNVLGEYTRKRLAETDPSSNLATVKNWQAETAEARYILDSGQHVPFMGLTRIDALFQKVDKGLILSPNELLEFADFIRSGKLINQFFTKNLEFTPLLHQYTSALPDLTQTEDLVYNKVKNGELIDDASRNLRKTRNRIRELEQKIQERLQKILNQAGYREIIQERLIVKKDGHLTIPIKTSFKHRLNGNVIDQSNHGATVFIEPEAVATMNEQLIMTQAEETAEVYQILAELTGAIAEHREQIDFLIEAITALDLIFARAKYSRELNGITPKVNKSERIYLHQAHHPLLPKDSVPLDFKLGDYRGIVITGPNAGGKTVVLKTVGLLTLMTMFGLQIPAAKDSEIAVVDELFVDIGDAQNMANELSTFSGHVAQIAEILNHTKRNSLILLDELGSGTEPGEGAALAIAVMEEMYKAGGLILATTHYAEIKNFAQEHEDFIPAAMAFDNETLTPKYQLQLGQVGASQALWIARKMQIKPSVIARADRYIHNHDYQLQKIDFVQADKTEEKNTHEKSRPLFKRGDRVLLKSDNIPALIFSDENPREETLQVAVGEEIREVLKKRVELVTPATELYPVGYNLDNLFGSYADRKWEHDLMRGSKKAQKELDKQMRERQKQNKQN